MRNRLLFSLLIIFSFLDLTFYKSFAQTILQPGDLAVIGLGANVGGNAGDCNTSNGISGRDLIAFVCFKDIESGTEIDITDNGWERVNPGQWGNTEGFLRLTRNGPTIPAGTVIILEFPSSGTGYIGLAPDNAWNFTPLGLNALNFNSNGDQIYFLQGGAWNSGTTQGCCNGSHDATYEGGRILFGFNSKTDWNSFENDSQDSGLHPAVQPCFHMEPSGGTTNFIAYSGSLEAGSQLEWINRISNPDNWSTFPDCTSFLSQANFALQLDLQINPMSIGCQICSSCGPIEEVLTFQLPISGGPFDVQYTNGTDTFGLIAINNGFTENITIDSSTTFALLSVTDNAGCPLYSNLGDSAVISVGSGIQIDLEINDDICDSDDLSTVSLTVDTSQINISTISWFDPNGNVIDSLNDEFLAINLISGDYTVIVESMDGCTSSSIFSIEENNIVSLICEIMEPASTNLANGSINYSITMGIPPYNINWTGPISGNDIADQAGTFAIMNLPSGEYEIEVTDNQGCQSTCMITVPTCDISLLCEPLGEVSTNGGNDGSAQITITNTSPPYEIVVEGPDSTFSFNMTQSTFQLDNLVVGNYNVSVSDQIGCTANCSFLIELANCELSLACQTISQVSLIGGSDGEVNIAFSGGDPPYNISWSGTTSGEIMENQASEMIIGALPAGIYELNLIDGAGCTQNCSFTIEEPTCSLDIIANSTPLSCNNLNNGSINIIAEGSNGSLSYNWNINQFDGLSELNNLSEGTYSVTVTDEAGCMDSISLEFITPEPLEVIWEAISPGCNNSEGSVNINTINGGIPPYNISVNQGATVVINNPPYTLNSLSPGTYDLLITDSGDCDFAFKASIENPIVLTLEYPDDLVIRSGDSILLEPIINFTPSSVIWESQGTVIDSSQLSIYVQPFQSTDYKVTAFDESGCSVVDQFVVTVDRTRSTFGPSAFSPNNDGINDRMTIFGGGDIEIIKNFQVFDRWGTLVYFINELPPNNENFGWDGKFQGQLMPTGVYVFTAEITYKDRTTEIARGSVALIR